MRENAFCMVFHVRWISHHSSTNPTLVATRLGRDSETRSEKNPSHNGKPHKMHIVMLHFLWTHVFLWIYFWGIYVYEANNL